MYMFNKKYQQSEFGTLTVLVFFYKWRKQFLYVGILALIVSSVVSFLIKPKYKSNVILFPSTNVSVSKALLSENPGQKQDIGQFGEEEEAEQLLQILQSDEIRDRIIQKYNLLDHYGISKNSKYPYSELVDEYEKNITIKQTEYLSVKITVFDTDPKTAANIANDIASLSDSLHNKVVRQRSEKALKLVEKKFVDLTNEIKSDEDSLSKLRALGVNDYETQSERLYEALGKAILDNKQGAIKSIEAKLENLSKYGGAYVSLRDAMEFKLKQVTFVKAKYEEAKLDAEQDLPYKFVVNGAKVAEKKAYPLRWVIVLSSVLATWLLMATLLVVLENYKRIRK